MAVCKNCGAEIDDDALFCKYCGKKLNNKIEQDDETSHNKSRHLQKTEDKILEILPDCAKTLNADEEACYPTSLFLSHEELQFKG